MEFQIGRTSKPISKRLKLPGEGSPLLATRYRHLYTAGGDAASKQSTCYRERATSRQAALLAGASKEETRSGRGKLRRRYVTWTIGPNALDAEPIKRRRPLFASMTSRGNDRGCRVVSRIRETILSLSSASTRVLARDRDLATRCVVLRRKFQRAMMTCRR